MPMKDSVASERMAPDEAIEAATIKGLTMLGRMCRADDAQARGPEHRRRRDVVLLPGLQHLAAGQSEIGGDADDPDGDHGVGQGRPERRRDGDGQQDAGKGQHGVDEAAQHVVRQPAQVAGREAQR